MNTHDPQDREHLRTLSTKKLRRLRVNVERSLSELQAYAGAVDAVLKERDG